MQIAPTRPPERDRARRATLPTAWYRVLGVPVAINSDVAEALLRVDESYAAFRDEPGAPAEAIALRLQRGEGVAGYLVAGAGAEHVWMSYEEALLDLLDRLVHALLERLLERGVYAIHAGAVSYRGEALVLAGRSGQGKTTLVLGLLRRGLRLLSDEFAIVEPGGLIMPYRRSLHIRPGTPELIPELRFLYSRPRHQIGGGNEWALTTADLERALPGCLGQAAAPRHLLLLEGGPRPGERPTITPTPAALAAIELLRGTWAASVDFAGGLSRISRMLDGVRCGRLRAGSLDATIDCILAWLEAADA